jgi:hypothetical protein
MKTPRQIILDRHRAVETQLDSARRTALNTLFRAPSVTPDRQTRAILQATPTLLLTLWRELILPARRTWIGLATVWVAIFVLRLAVHDDAVATLAQSTVNSPRPATLLRDQQQLWIELAIGPEVVPVAPAKTVVPKPRSEWRVRHGAG